MHAPPLGPRVPARGNALTRAIGRAMLGLGGWRIDGTVPDEPKFVLIVAPHTSNWDFFVGLGALFAIGFRVSFLGKDSIFTWPLGIFMRWLGGIPVERTVSRDRVSQMVAAFNASEQLILVIAPEGTRKLVPEWKSGFYHVANGAGVPIVPVAFDFAKKSVEIFAPFRTTGDRDSDLARIKDQYRDVAARHPENFAL